MTLPRKTRLTRSLALLRNALTAPLCAPERMRSQGDGCSSRSKTERPSTMPFMKSVSSEPTLKTTLPGRRRRSCSAFSAAIAT